MCSTLWAQFSAVLPSFPPLSPLWTPIYPGCEALLPLALGPISLKTPKNTAPGIAKVPRSTAHFYSSWTPALVPGMPNPVPGLVLFPASALP